MKNKAKQTAVEWLALELYEKIQMKGDGNIFDDILNQALQMEEYQIERAFDDGYCNGKDNPNNFNEQYYTDTYGEKS